MRECNRAGQCVAIRDRLIELIEAVAQQRACRQLLEQSRRAKRRQRAERRDPPAQGASNKHARSRGNIDRWVAREEASRQREADAEQLTGVPKAKVDQREIQKLRARVRQRGRSSLCRGSESRSRRKTKKLTKRERWPSPTVAQDQRVRHKVDAWTGRPRHANHKGGAGADRRRRPHNDHKRVYGSGARPDGGQKGGHRGAQYSRGYHSEGR